MYGWTLSTIFSLLFRFMYSLQNTAAGPTIGLEGFVIINCTTKGPSVSVSWLEIKNGHREESSGSKIASKVDPMQSITDTCCSVRTWNVTLKNKESLVGWRWKNSSKEVVTCEGADVELFCNATGFSFRQVSWRRRRDLFPGKSYIISNVQRQDHGTYSCEASNGAGATLKKDINLVVEFPPMITVPNKDINGSSEEECILQCMVEAYPSPAITWYKEDIILDVTSDPHYEVTVQKSENCTTLSILRVVIVYNGTLIKNRFGNYTCQAENRHGRSVASLRLMAPFDRNVDTMVDDGEYVERKFNVTGFIIGMLPPIFISVYIIIKLGYRSRYAEERGEEEGMQEEPFFVSH